jgi:DNA-directed RNA polymerase specialized sigma24 family protein
MDEDPRTDAELLRATPTEIEAFGVFYRRHVKWVLGFLARRLNDAESAADLTSEVFAAALLGALPVEQREAVQARVLHDRDYDEIASTQQITEATARKRVSRGLAALRARIAEREDSA